MNTPTPREPEEQLRITLFRGDSDPDTWIEVCGEADILTSVQLHDQLFAALGERGQCHSAILDLRQLSFSDVECTQTMVAFAEAAKDVGCEVTFFGLKPIMLRLLNILGLRDRVRLA